MIYGMTLYDFILVFHGNYDPMLYWFKDITIRWY